MINIENKYIKSPLNYVGGKYKLLPQIIPLIPDNINTFVDLFGGAFNVGLNVKSNKVHYNDNDIRLVELLKYLTNETYETIFNNTMNIIEKYNLSKTYLNGFEFYQCSSKTGRRIGIYNEDKYNKLRDAYNENPNPEMLFVLSCFSFNYQIRFNSNGKFNMPVGKQDFNKAVHKKIEIFKKEIVGKQIEFFDKDFNEFDFQTLSNDDFVYCDPPYYNSIATYNENGKWTEENENDLLNRLDYIHKNNGKFALSNNLKYENQLLDNWKNKYNVHYLNENYANCNYQKIDKSEDIEVLITNY